MEVAIILIVVVVVAVVGWWLLQRQNGQSEPVTAMPDDFSGERPPTSLEFDGSTAIATFDVEVPADGPDAALRDLLIRQAREALRGKGVDVEWLSIRAWRGGHVTQVVRVSETVADADVADVADIPEAADFDPLGDLHSTDFSTEAAAPRVVGELAPVGQELGLTRAVKDLLAGKGIDPSTMTMTEMTIALLESSGYSVTAGSTAGTYDASAGGSRTFLTIIDHEKGGYPELDEEVVNSFVIHFVSSGADRGLLFTDKYCPYVVYDKERREPRIRFITRERLQAFVDSVAMR
jgi:hypothetical protein